MASSRDAAVEREQRAYDLYLREREAIREWTRIALQAIAGIVVALGAFSAWQQVTEARTGQITDRFAQAIEHLGDQEAVDVRIGGIYSLERIAQDSDRDRRTVSEVLSAFVVRTTTQSEQETSRVAVASDNATIADDELSESEDAEGRREVVPGTQGNQHDVASVPPDVTAAITVVARLYPRRAPTEIDLSGANLSGADLTRASLSEADLSGANLRHADLQDASLFAVNLRSADLRSAILRDADLVAADLRDADLSTADVSNADLRGACSSSETSFPRNFDAVARGVTTECDELLRSES